MQIAAAELYPGFTRPVFLKGYRYNMHMCPKSMLIEVGAQTNTFEEVYNAMDPLANILAYVLLGQSHTREDAYSYGIILPNEQIFDRKCGG